MTSDLFKHANARVAGSYLQPLLETASAGGLTPFDLARASGLPDDFFSPLPESIAASHYVDLLARAADMTQDAFFGLHCGERVKLGTYTVYGLILLSCHHIGQVLQQTMRYEGLAHDLGRSQLQVDGALASYQWHSHFPGASRHLVESVFAGIRVFGTWLTGHPLPARRLCFTHANPGLPQDEYLRVLGMLPEFSASHNRAEFDAAILALPVPNADVSMYPVLQQHAEQLLQNKSRSATGTPPEQSALDINGSRPAPGTLNHGAPSIVQLVKQTIAQNLAQDQVRLSSIAAQLQLNPRTLQRKLNEAGASFQRLLDQTRYQLACDYMRQANFSLVDIAFLLGYQEQSSFNHAFKEWSGFNPGAYRERLRTQQGTALH
ncbi:MAG: hypothetical protein RL748_2026 [Pseudomonadota bacterium]|jgi:AraC-like DNA-binding protein